MFNKMRNTLSNYFRKKNRHLGRNRFLSVELQAEIMAAAAQKRMNRERKRVPIHHQQTRLGLFK